MPFTPKNPLHVVSLQVDSYKRLKAAHVEPTATGLVLVRGRNAQGKSSLIDSLLDVFGLERSKLPITEGEHGAVVAVDLGEIVVVKRWTRDSGGKAKASLTIEGADGSRITSPAAVLKTLVGHFADPVAFLNLAPAEQVKTVLRVLGLDEELARLEEIHEGQYEKRRDLGREADRITKAAAELELELGALPMEMPEGSAQEDGQLMRDAGTHNAQEAAFTAQRNNAAERGKALSARIATLEGELAKAKAEKAQRTGEWNEANDALKTFEPIEIAPLMDRIKKREEITRYEGKVELLEQTQADAANAVGLHEETKSKLEETRLVISNLLTAAKFPVDGMAYDLAAKTLTIGGIPLTQCSQAERLRAGACIAMSGNPAIRVIFAKEGSLIDDDGRIQLAQLAEERGFQLWLEVVDSNAKGSGIWIEDGEAFEEPKE